MIAVLVALSAMLVLGFIASFLIPDTKEVPIPNPAALRSQNDDHFTPIGTEVADIKRIVSELMVRPTFKSPRLINRGDSELFFKIMAEGNPESPVSLNTEILNHILLWGPPGTGKTSMAELIKSELHQIYGFEPQLFELTPLNLRTEEQIGALLRKIGAGTIVFIDEIHGLEKTAMENLLPVLEGGKLMSGLGRAKRLPPHTFIGATTEPGRLLEPLRDRFTIEVELKPLEENEIFALVRDFLSGVKFPEEFNQYRGQDEAKLLVWMHLESLNKPDRALPEFIQHEIARRAIGIPRIAKNFSKHFMALSKALEEDLTEDDMEMCFQLLGVDKNGLHRSDRRVTRVLLGRNNIAMGLASLASAAQVDKADLENTIENRLLRLGYLERTPRGRILTQKALSEYREKDKS